jgi:hypothetical protein
MVLPTTQEDIMTDFTFILSGRTEDKFDGGLSFIEDIALDRFNVEVVKAVTILSGTDVTVRGTDADIADFLKYLRTQSAL